MDRYEVLILDVYGQRLIETNVPLMGLRTVVRNLWADGFDNTNIVIRLI